MSESERSEAFGTPMSSDDAAELEELRREAALLREQLENAVGPQSGLRSARDVHQLEARIDSLAARNAKLMETLKEARQQLLALREEVDRLGQPPSGYGVLLAVHDDDTVDVFTSGRKMRLTCSPNIDTKSLKQGPDRPPQRGADGRRGRQLRSGRRDQHAARDPVRRPPRARGRSRRRGAHRLAGRAVGGGRGPARTARRGRSTTICGRASCAPATRCWSTPRPATRSSASPRPRSRTWCSKRCPTSATTTSAAWAGRSSRSATPSNCRSCTRSSTASTRCARPRACCSTARPAAARR